MGLMVKISKSYCDICNNEKECVRLDDDGPKYENNVIYMCGSCLREGLELLNELEYFCDEKRHIVCEPYSIENLHKMAEALKVYHSVSSYCAKTHIATSWWNKKPELIQQGYDIGKIIAGWCIFTRRSTI